MLPASHISHTVKENKRCRWQQWESGTVEAEGVSWDQSSYDRWDRWNPVRVQHLRPRVGKGREGNKNETERERERLKEILIG